MIEGLRSDLVNTSDPRDACEVVRDFCSMSTRSMAAVSKIIVLVLATFHLVKEVFQLTQVCLHLTASSRLPVRLEWVLRFFSFSERSHSYQVEVGKNLVCDTCPAYV